MSILSLILRCLYGKRFDFGWVKGRKCFFSHVSVSFCDRFHSLRVN